MLGAIAGDIVGSVYEFDNHRSKDFPLLCDSSRFTDDTVLTCATAFAIMNEIPYAKVFRNIGIRYADAAYGARFMHWLLDDRMGPYNSYGNGSAMRVSPVAWAFDTEEKVLAEAAASALVSHNHPEGVKGAQATALAIFRARKGASKDAIRDEISARFDYDLQRSVDELRRVYRYNETCQETVPEAIICFLEASDFEDALRNAVSIGGDSDTLAAICGSIAEAAFGGVPVDIRRRILDRLDDDLLAIVDAFERYLRSPARQ